MLTSMHYCMYITRLWKASVSSRSANDTVQAYGTGSCTTSPFDKQNLFKRQKQCGDYQ